MVSSVETPICSVVLAVAAAAILTPRGVAAAPPEEDAPTWSRKLWKQGEVLANEGQWREACPHFRAAHELNSTGGTALRSADCYEKIGSYERAREMYRWVVDHAATDTVPDRVKLAAARLEALDKQLRVEREEPAKAPVSPLPTLPAPPSRVPAIVAFSLGGTGAVIGGVFGAVALAEAAGVKSDARARCPDQACSDPDLAARKSRANTHAWVANVGIGVAIAGAALGTVLLFVSPGKKPESTPAKVVRALGAQGLTIHF